MQEQIKAADKGRKMREDEIVDAMDRICMDEMDNYGLVLDPKTQTPTDEWSRVDAVSSRNL